MENSLLSLPCQTDVEKSLEWRPSDILVQFGSPPFLDKSLLLESGRFDPCGWSSQLSGSYLPV